MIRGSSAASGKIDIKTAAKIKESEKRITGNEAILVRDCRRSGAHAPRGRGAAFPRDEVLLWLVFRQPKRVKILTPQVGQPGRARHLLLDVFQSSNEAVFCVVQLEACALIKSKEIVALLPAG